LAKKELGELGVQPKKVIAVSVTETTLEAFGRMVDNNVHSVAILDENGALLTNLSAKDLKLVAGEEMYMSIYKVNKPVLEYVQQVRSRGLNAFPAAITCKLAEKFSRIVEKLAASKVHRLYVTQVDHSSLIGVVALSDVVNLALNYYHSALSPSKC